MLFKIKVSSLLCYGLAFLFLQIPIYDGQMIVPPGPDVQDPFKENPKWAEFKLTQYEKLDTLKTLVDNAWILMDGITNPSNQTSLRENFIKFHTKSFIQFFNEPNERIRDGVPFTFLSTAIGIHNASTLEELTSKNKKSNLEILRLKWFRIHEMGKVLHTVFNQTTQAFLDYASNPSLSSNFMQDILDYESEEHQLLSLNSSKTAAPGKLTYQAIVKLLDQEIKEHEGNQAHPLRSLLQLLVQMKQSQLDVKQDLNFFCFGNNEFGVIPDLFDIISDSGLYLIMADMKAMILDVYSLLLKTLLKIKEAPVNRVEIWNEMKERVIRKIDFPEMDGLGWPNPAGPIVFKCDMPPQHGSLNPVVGQWGRNVSTGLSPNASQTFAYDPPGGQMKPNLTLGYYDRRIPNIQAIGFDGTYQGYIESELALSATGSCRDTCPIFKRKTQLCKSNPFHCPLYRNSHCKKGQSSKPEENICLSKKGCPLHAMKCKRTGREVQICHSSQPNKRLDWIMFDGVFMGRNMNRTNDDVPECSGGIVTLGKERWELESGVILTTPRYCELCLCTCMSESSPSDTQYFDIQPIRSDVQDGKLISAVKFIKEDNVIRLAVEQGAPKFRGFIDDSTLQWVKPLPFEKGNLEKTVPFGVNGFTKFNLDLVIGEVGTVVTGIKFNFDPQNQTISIQIETTPIQWPIQNPHEISLLANESQWVEPISFTDPREPIIFEDPGDPFQQTGPSMPDSVLNSYVEFQTTTYEQDLAQTVIPLFDTQQVHYHEGRRWLRGIGIMHKGKPESGGFLSPLILPASPYKLVQYYPKPQKEIK